MLLDALSCMSGGRSDEIVIVLLIRLLLKERCRESMDTWTGKQIGI